MHHVEARIVEEERARTAEFGFVKDAVKKLIVAFENSLFVGGSPVAGMLGASGSSRHNYVGEDTVHTVSGSPREGPFLPSLLSNPRSPQGQSGAPPVIKHSHNSFLGSISYDKGLPDVRISINSLIIRYRHHALQLDLTSARSRTRCSLKGSDT